MGQTLFGALGLFSLNILLYCGYAQGVPQPVLTVSPSWTSPGDSVTLTCSVEPPSAGWRFFWFKAVPDMSSTNTYYNFELLAGGTNGTEQDSYILHGQTHTAGYQCRAERGDPVFYTQYSDVKFVWSGGEFVQTFIFLHKGINVLFVLTLFVLCVSPNDVSSGVNPAASLTVSPHRLQHFSTESLSLICEGNSAEWRVMKVHEYGHISSCYNWGEMTGSTCNTTTASSGVYWCESVTQSSNAANITIHNPEEAASSSVFLVPLVVGLVSGVLLIILLLLFLRRYRKSEASSLSRSQRTNQSPATDHMINQDESSLTYSVVELKHLKKKEKHDEPDESPVYSDVRIASAADYVTYAQVHPPTGKKSNEGKSRCAAEEETVYSEVKPGTFDQ
uniref:Ig-like domain-containing protein n=1 Tax=Gasterosteus aculeatus aculeatus TaxID=481459 RepID=A0AAQ4PWU1_GASAC